MTARIRGRYASFARRDPVLAADSHERHVRITTLRSLSRSRKTTGPLDAGPGHPDTALYGDDEQAGMGSAVDDGDDLAPAADLPLASRSADHERAMAGAGEAAGVELALRVRAREVTSVARWHASRPRLAIKSVIGTAVVLLIAAAAGSGCSRAEAPSTTSPGSGAPPAAPAGATPSFVNRVWRVAQSP